MTITTKFIDVTKTFLPIDPKAFPESLLGADSVGRAEDRVPVSAYEGQNIMPTPYGYRSFFGTGQTLDIPALEGRVDYVFMYQNESLVNILIALCDNGIWASSEGSWVNLHSVSPDVDPLVHSEWTCCVLANAMYCYRAGGPSYVRINGELTVAGVSAEVIVPSFLNMVGQMGIFRAGGRLGFWDSSNSVSWSDLDTKADFTPSLETLAGYATFSDVKGRIVTILPHGKGFIIYATKGIIFVGPSDGTAYQWAASVIMQDSGISYPRQATSGVPDTTHFAYTPTAIYKIEKAVADVIIPEVTHYLQESTEPIYLHMISGRYLFIEIIQKDFMRAHVQFSEGTSTGLRYEFPDTSYEIAAIPAINVQGEAMCELFAAITSGHAPGMQNMIRPEDADANAYMKPIWTAYLSEGACYDVSNLTWDIVPCSGAEAYPMSPVGVAKGDDLFGRNLRAVTGAEDYLDGIWTIERFMAAQYAIWEAEDKNKSQFLTALSGRYAPRIDTTQARFSLESFASTHATDDCALGRYAGEFGAAKFDYNRCSFWLTRTSTHNYDLVTRTVTTTGPVDSIIYSLPYNKYTFAGTDAWDSVSAALAALSKDGAYTNITAQSTGVAIVAELVGGSYKHTAETPNSMLLAYGIAYNSTVSAFIVGMHYRWDYPDYELLPSPTPSATVLARHYPRWGKNTVISSRNVLIRADTSPIVDMAYCKITGYTYTRKDGTQGYVAAPDCVLPTGNLGGDRNASLAYVEAPLNTGEGSICSLPFDSTLVEIPGVKFDWNVPDLAGPDSTFLLQHGSTAPVYPTMTGAFVYDTHLKKWGKIVSDYRVLLDYSPANASLGSMIAANNTGMMAGAVKLDNSMCLFDDKPTNSYIIYGKIGYYRGGITSAEDISVMFRTPSSGTLSVQTSMDGRMVASLLSKKVDFSAATKASISGCFPGVWHNVTITGKFDINYLEYRGFKQGRR